MIHNKNGSTDFDNADEAVSWLLKSKPKVKTPYPNGICSEHVRVENG